MGKHNISNVRRVEEIDGGLIEIEHYGRPSQLNIRDKRNNNSFMVRLREDLEILFAEIQEVDDELEARIQAFKHMIQEWKHEKNTARKHVTRKG